MGLDNRATLAWLDYALRYSFDLARPQLRAYLEAVLDEVLFEMERDLGAHNW